MERLSENAHPTDTEFVYHFFFKMLVEFSRDTYINMTPQHVFFSVVFGPDGRLAEVKPVYGWD